LELRYSTEQLEFLDTMTSIRKGRLVSDLYTKPTDRHLYLHMDSSHTESTKKAIPYGLVGMCITTTTTATNTSTIKTTTSTTTSCYYNYC
ncbi:hypothetical protein DPMN_177545, partial [Dreissena polymorpha]